MTDDVPTTTETARVARTRYLILILLLMGVAAVLLLRTPLVPLPGVPGIRGGDSPEGPAVRPVTAGDPGTVETVRAANLTFAEIRILMNSINAERRRGLLADEEDFREFVRLQARKRSLVAAAGANNLQDNPRVRYLMQRAADEVLERVYLEQLISQQLPEDFPSAGQVREFYDNNEERFRLGERVPVWQIFLRSGDQARERAEAIAAELERGDTGFAEAALRYSAHEASRGNGGYMGLLSVEAIRPALKETLLNLEAGAISEPVESEEGVHIFRRGETVAARRVPLDEVRGEIRSLLRRQATRRLREALYDKAAETYPVELTDRRLRDWRQRLRTDSGGAAGAAGQQP